MSDDDGPFASAAARRSALGRTAAAAVALVLVVAGLHLAVPQVTDPAWLRRTVARFGPFAPLAFVALQTAQVVLAPIPGQLLAGVGGYLFGPLAGTAYSMAGVLAGSTVVFLAARRYGRPYVERVLAPAAVERWDEVVERGGLSGIFLLFLLPTFPDDLLCAVVGLTDVRLRTFLAVVLVGRTPSFLAVAYAGGRLAGGAVTTALAVLAVLTLATAAVYAVRRSRPDGVEGSG